MKYSEASSPKRTRIINNKRGKCSMSVKYFIYNTNTREKVQVCQKAFLDTLLLSKNRVNNVISKNLKNGCMPTEQRGGDRRSKTFEGKLKSVIQFIKTFNIIENHYCRNKTSSRLYLNSDLNIKKMWRFYNTRVDETFKVKESFFRHVFRTRFNIGFGRPRVDECSTCISLNERLKQEKHCDDKQNLLTEHRVHKLKYKAFYTLLKEEREDLLTISFDCQKNQVLPKVPDQIAYYSRQLYKYNFTIVVGSSKCAQTKTNVYIYQWDETEQNKGSNEISSAVYHFLFSFLHIPETVKEIRFVSDGCGGQNKNSTMIGMLAVWFINSAPKHLEKIEFLYPVVGHSFLPADRVFARIEKEIKTRDVIINPSEYNDIFSEYGTVVPLADNVFDWKSTLQNIIRPPGQWHFKFNPAKRIFFKKNKKEDNVLLQGEAHYRTQTGAFKSVCKRGKVFKDTIQPLYKEKGVRICSKKFTDVINLVEKHFGQNWREFDSLKFYKNLEQVHVAGDEPSEPQDLCERMEEVADLVI